MSLQLLLLNGPNLNLLGLREPEIYGRATLKDIEFAATAAAEAAGAEIICRQSNHEGAIVNWIHEARGARSAIIINAGAYTHTSIAILDALRAFDGLVVELHISNPHQREAYRHFSYIAQRADALIAGFGVAAYPRAVAATVELLNAKSDA